MNFRRICALFLIFILLLSGCTFHNKKTNLTYTDVLYDTIISIQILDAADETLLEECADLCKKYDLMFSRTNPESEIYKINHAKGKPVEVSDDTISIIESGIYYSQVSDGAFDLTIGSVSSLWDFKSEEKSIPSKNSIENAVSHVDYNKISINGNTVQLADPEMMLDVGALAKGYIADRLKDFLIENGIENALINLGGNIYALGHNMNGSSYNIGIQKPFDESGQPITSVKISDKTIVTTGIYQRYFEKNDQLYHHIIEPKTGYPCENNLFSVTIVTDSSLTADALSTTCFLLGFDKGMKLINELDNVDAIFITNDNELHYSDNFAE